MKFKSKRQYKKVKHHTPCKKGDQLTRTTVTNLADELTQATKERDTFHRAWEAEKAVSNMYKNLSSDYKHKYIIRHYSTIFLAVICASLVYYILVH